MAANVKTVCVTGSTGFLGLWIVKKLLERGYKVHATARSERKASLIPKHDNLQIFTGCDLMIPDSFNNAIENCDVVLHTASPFFWGGNEEDLVKPALEGTRNVLTSCQKAGVKEVVVTSSTAAVYTWYGTKPKEYVYSAEDFSPEELCRQHQDYYSLSKLLAEKLAWKMADGHFKLSTVCPSLIFGPILECQASLNTSSKNLLDYFSETGKKIANKCTNIVDVRDVAMAHILIFEKQQWNDRFILVSGCPHWKKIVETASCAIGKSVSTEIDEIKPTVYGAPYPNPSLIDVHPSIEKLGMKYIPIKESIEENIKSTLKFC